MIGLGYVGVARHLVQHRNGVAQRRGMAFISTPTTTRTTEAVPPPRILRYHGASWAAPRARPAADYHDHVGNKNSRDRRHSGSLHNSDSCSYGAGGSVQKGADSNLQPSLPINLAREQAGLTGGDDAVAVVATAVKAQQQITIGQVEEQKMPSHVGAAAAGTVGGDARMRNGGRRRLPKQGADRDNRESADCAEVSPPSLSIQHENKQAGVRSDGTDNRSPTGLAMNASTRHSYEFVRAVKALQSMDGDGSRSGSKWRQVLMLLDKAEHDADFIPERPVTSHMYSCCVSYMAKCHRWKDALGILARIQSRGGVPDIFSLNAAIDACANTRQWRTALGLLEKARQEGWQVKFLSN